MNDYGSGLWALGLDLFSVDGSGSRRQRQIAEIDTLQSGRPRLAGRDRRRLGERTRTDKLASSRAAMSTTAPTDLYAVAGIRAALARTDGDPARRYTAMPAATSAITALP